MSGSNIHILIVEDSTLVARNLEQKLTGLGYTHIHRARNRTEAFAVLEQHLIDIVLMDIGLQGSEVDGIDLAHEIGEQHDTAIIFVTAYSDKATLDRSMLVKHHNFLIKPVDDRQLYVAIHKALASRLPLVQQQALSSPPAPGTPGAIYVKSKQKHYERVNTHDIILIEAELGGVNIKTSYNTWFTYNSIQSVLDLLAPSPLVRIHKSVAINTEHATAKSDGEIIMSDGRTYVIGKKYKEAVEPHFRVLRPKQGGKE